MIQPRGRTRSCGADEAWDRYLHAQSFVDTAELVLEDTTREGYANVSGALAVLAGIAIADAVCCEVLGRRHRGEDHRAASDLLRQVAQIGCWRSKTRPATRADFWHEPTPERQSDGLVE